MKKFLSLFTLSLSMFIVQAQNNVAGEIQNKAITTDTTKKANKKGWTRGASVGLALTQIGNKNWVAAGSDKFSLSFAGNLNAFATRKWGRNTWENMLDFSYGIVNTTSLGTRKVNDRLELITKYRRKPKYFDGYPINWVALGQLRSQLTSGYQYDYLGTDTKRRNSGFFAPAYVTGAIGIEYLPKEWLSIVFAPLSSRITLVTNGPYSYAGQGGIFNGQTETPLATLYGVNPAKGIDGDIGCFASVTAKKNLLKNVAYYGRLELYKSYLSKDADAGEFFLNLTDLFWTNQFRVNLSKWLNISYSLDMLYDHDIKNPKKLNESIGFQFLSTFGVGVAFKM